MEVRLEYKDAVYGFSRNEDGRGYWYCLRGRIPGNVGRSNSFIIVPRSLEPELFREALNRKILTEKDLHPPKKAERKTIRVAQAKPKTELKGAFNPFADFNKTISEVETEQAFNEIKQKNRPKDLIEKEDNTSFFEELFQPDDFEMESDEDSEELVIEELESEIIG